MAFSLPETSRNVVGNGSIKPPKYLRLPLPNLMCHWTSSDDLANVRWRVPNPLKSLKIITRKDNAVVMLAAGLLYVVYTCINASLSILFIDVYKLNQWQAGLTYLPFGVGGIVSTCFTGRLIDKTYRNFRLKKGLSTDRDAGDELDNFPIERARLRVVWVPMLLTACSVMAFGWIYNTLLVDKNYRTPAAAQASSNIVRCSLAAIAVSFLQDLIAATGIGGTFTFLSGLCLVATGLFGVDYVKGTSWRQKTISPFRGQSKLLSFLHILLSARQSLLIQSLGSQKSVLDPSDVLVFKLDGPEGL
ncbi:MAG: hypothetical protein Q9178_003101 [Gyalolechia marmorata]